MKLLHLIGGLLLTLQVAAVPARFHIFRARMSDGTFQNIRFYGDENGSYYVNEEGFVVEKDANGRFYVTFERPHEVAEKRKVPGKRLGDLETAPIKSIGTPKIPVILVNFSDVKFSVANTDEKLVAYYDRYCNGTFDGNLYTGAGSSGAVRDYFVQQSDSLFLPQFEVIGPVTLTRPMSYYGQNGANGVKDINYREFTREALSLAVNRCSDFKDLFDNDGDGIVDLAFFIYAGLPESDPGVTEDAIWPKEMISPTTIGGITIAVSACCSELSKTSKGDEAAGIGTMCHEVSHSLGMPDEYDTRNVALGMSYWSLMDSGNFCNNGRTPCGMTAYERSFLNWRPLVTLKNSTTVRLRPLEAGGRGYKIVNEEEPNEYYILENRQAIGWDRGLSRLGHGMLVVHVDYNTSAWGNNALNTDETHQRMSFIPANNVYVGPKNAKSAVELLEALNGQLYPGTTGNTSLTNESTPASVVFQGGFMNKPITSVREMENGDIIFKYMPKGRLKCPVLRNAEDITFESFKLKWDVSENAMWYDIVVYGVDEDERRTENPVFRADSLNVPACIVTLDGFKYKRYVYSVSAMADDYEDSPFSVFGEVELPADGIGEIETGNKSEVKMYTMSGILVQPSDRDKLHPGVYIINEKGKTRKVIIKNQ